MQQGECADECAICFEAIPEPVLLPCSCRIAYCFMCWDQALAAAFNDCGHARCPTCRSPVRVDFDPQARNGRGSLVFSPDDGPRDDESAADLVGHVVNRLAGQAAPLMTRLLRQYGEEHPSLRRMAADLVGTLSERPVRDLKALLHGLGGDSAGCVEKAELIERMCARAGGPSHVAAYVSAFDIETRSGHGANTDGGGDGGGDGGSGVAAVRVGDDLGPNGETGAPSATDGAPAGAVAGVTSSGGGLACTVGGARCVCGGVLERMEGRARMKQLFSSQVPPHMRESEAFEQLLDMQVSTAQATSLDPRPRHSLALALSTALPWLSPWRMSNTTLARLGV